MLNRSSIIEGTQNMLQQSGKAMNHREAKSLEIAARFKLTFQDGYWTVPSMSGNGSYRVVLKANSATCTCDDHQVNGQQCKHILACRLVLERECGAASLPIDTETLPERPTYTQDWPKYNEAQQTEKDRFQVLLHDLCRDIPEPPKSKKGRNRTPLADQVFAVAFKVYCTLSARRFACDLRASHEKGYLSKLMNSITINAYMENPALTPILNDLLIKSSLPLAHVEDSFAPDSSGFSVSRFVRWVDEKYGTIKSGRDWVKAHAICGTKTHIVTAVEIHDRDAADCPQFKPLVETTAKNFTIKEVPADKAYLSHDNLELVEKLGGTAFVPFKINSGPGEEGSLWNKMFGYYQFRREEFLKHYHARSNAESLFSMVKAKFGDSVRSRVDVAMKNETLCKFLCHNICVVHQSHIELGIEPVFWGEAEANNDEMEPAILPMIRKRG
jgi:transposase